MLVPQNIGDFLNLWHFFGNYMVFGDGSLGCGFKIKGKDVSCATADEINQFTRKLENLITGLGTGTSLQILYKLTPKVDSLVEEHLSLSRNCPLEGYRKIMEGRTSHLKSHREMGYFFEPEIYCFLKGLPFAFRKQGIFQKTKPFTKAQAKDFETHVERFERTVSHLESSLKDGQLFKSRLSSKEWFELLYEHFNLSRSEVHRVPELKGPRAFSPSSLLSQFLLSDIHLSSHDVMVGSYKFRAVSLRTLPDETYSGLIRELLALPFHCWISQVVKVCDQTREYNVLQLKRRIAHSMASSERNHVQDLESESKLGQIEGLLSDIIDSSEKVVEADLNVIIWGKTTRELDEKCDEVLRTFKSLNHSEGLVETFATLDTFLKTTPGLCQTNRPKKMKSSNLSHLLPVFSFWRGNNKPTCLVTNRDHVLVSIDPFAPELPNWNGFVIGSSGSGKSFTISQLILMFIGDQT